MVPSWFFFQLEEDADSANDGHEGENDRKASWGRRFRVKKNLALELDGRKMDRSFGHLRYEALFGGVVDVGGCNNQLLVAIPSRNF